MLNFQEMSEKLLNLLESLPQILPSLPETIEKRHKSVSGKGNPPPKYIKEQLYLGVMTAVSREVNLMVLGRIQEYDIREGQGLILPDGGGKLVAVFYQSLSPGEDGKCPTLYPGDKVRFDVEDCPHRLTTLNRDLGAGLLARNVEVVESASHDSERYPFIIY